MDIVKAHWHSNGDKVSLNMPISKVNTETRIVSGFASVDSLDEHDDVITAACAVDAFERFRGNIREMHQPVAVGKVVSFSQEPIYDEKTASIYNGVFVNAYVSTGAQDTWEKVVDGTLSGFSIGGNLLDSSEVYDEEKNKIVRYITKMDLFELSLVDNPANQLANIVSISKGEVTGLAVDVDIDNVYWCEHDRVSRMAKGQEAPICFSCEQPMSNIGWIESNEDRVVKMRQVVDSFVIKSKGGVDMATKNKETVDAEVIEKTADETVVDDAEVVEKAATDVSEVEPDKVELENESEEDESEDDELEKSEDKAELAELIGGLQEFISQAVAKAVEDIVSATQAGVAEVSAKSLDKAMEKIDEVEKSIDDKVGAIKQEFSGVSDRVEAVEKGTAIKKSGELGRASEVNKGLWAGTFLGSDDSL